jgi:hypothetical protein
LASRSPFAVAGLAALVLLAGLVGGYSWYWNQLADGVRDGLNIWLGQRRAEGFVAEKGLFEISGFPLSVEGKLARLTLGRGEEGEAGYWRWVGRKITTNLKPWTPTRVDFATNAPQSAVFADKNGDLRDLAVAAKETTGQVEISATGRLATINLEFQALALAGSALVGPVLIGQAKAQAELLQDTRLDIQANNLQLPAEADPVFGQRVEVFRLQSIITGKIPGAWSRPAVTAWRDDGGTVEVTRARVKWGSLDMTAEGTLALDGRMHPLGSGTTTISGHNESLRSLVEKGLITPLNAAALSVALNMMGRDANGTVRFPITAQDGRVKVGPVSAIRLKPLRFPGD